MRKIAISPYRWARKILKKRYITSIRKIGNDFVLIIPNEIVKAFKLQVKDVAVFEIIAKDTIVIRFVKNNLYSFVEYFDKIDNH